MINFTEWFPGERRSRSVQMEFAEALDCCHPDAAVHWDRDVAGSLDPSLEIDTVYKMESSGYAEVLFATKPFPGFYRYVVHEKFTGWVRVTEIGPDGKLRSTPEFEFVQREVYGL